MNGPKLPASKEPASQRPPAVGKEDKTFHDTSQFLERHRTIEHKPSTDLKASMEYHKLNIEANNSPNPIPPPAFRWAQSLQCLLDDHQGVDLFREFLTQEGHETRSLDFRFGALGLQKADPSDTEKLKKMINVLYEKMVRRIPSISPSVKDEIKNKLSSGIGIDVDIFDAAREEVEAYMLKNTYPNFLNSDLYIQHLEPAKGKDYSNNQLPTLHEGKELNISLSKKLFARLGQRKLQKVSIVKTSAEVQAGYLKSPSAPYHTKYAPFCVPSARDSELQSLSSGVQTDDTMSLTDTSVTDYPTSKNKLKRQQKSKMDSNPNPIVLNRDCFNQENFIPRTQQPVAEHIANTAATEPATFAAILTQRLLKVQEEKNKDAKNKEKVIEKLKSLESNDCIKADASPGQKFLLYAPEEDNNQAILDNHISMVFAETPTRSPACATPPAAKALEGCSRVAQVRCSVDSNLSQDLNCGSRSLRGEQRSPFFGSFGGRLRQDPDTRSNDSGALTDWMSEDNLSQCHRNAELENVSYDSHLRRAREKLNKSKKLSTLTGSSSSCFDSGVSSTACEPLVQPSHQKVTTWLEAKRSALEVENERQGRTSPVPSRSSSSRRACSSSRSGCMDMSAPSSWGPSQQVLPDPSNLTPQDTTSNLWDVKRILEDRARASKTSKSKYMHSDRSCHDAARGKVSSRAFDAVDDGISHRKQSKKSSSGDTGASNNEMTIVGYSFGLDSVPYKTKLSGKNITLRQFKTHLNKKGNYRYFFKRLNDDFGTKVVFDEVTDDYEILPLWEGKVFCVIEAMDDGALMNDD